MIIRSIYCNNKVHNKELLKLMYNQDQWEDDFEDYNDAPQKKTNTHNDKYDKLEADRKILKKQNNNASGSLNFGNSPQKSKEKAKKVQRYDDENGYGDDFEVEEDKQKSRLKNSFSKNNNSTSFDHKPNKNKTDKKLNRSPTEKKKISKSSMSLKRDQNTKGRYTQEVEKKFYENSDPATLSSDAINRVNTQIREAIRKYNDILSELITKNLNAFMQAKNKKPHTIDDQIKVLQEEIKNNEKIEERLQGQAKGLNANVQKIEEKEQYSQIGIQDQIAEAKKQIKQKKKALYQKKLQIQNEAKKLTGIKNVIAQPSFKDSSSDVTILKQKLTNMRKEFQKNQQKIEELQKREANLSKKIGQIEGKQKQADQIIIVNKKNQQKSKKYQEARKKLQNVRNHSKKTTTLWQTKNGAAEHENEAIRLKIKNIELQIKNLEQSISSVYEKTQKILSNPKIKKGEEGVQQKLILDKMVDQMKVYDPNGMKKQQSTTQMKLFPNKRTSSSINLADQDGLRKSETEQQNRVWKEEENKEKQIQKVLKKPEEHFNKKIEEKDIKEAQIKKERYEKNPNDMTITNEENQGEGDQKQNKPKRFNFKKNRESSEVKLTELQSQVQPTKQQIMMNPKDKTPKHHSPQVQTEKTNIQQSISAPKRFNLRTKKNTEQGYQPSQQQSQNNSQKNLQETEIEKKDDPINQNTNNVSRPMFKLKKKNRESSEHAENQFIS